MSVSTASALVFILKIKQHNTLSLWNGYQINPKIIQNIFYSHGFKSEKTFVTLEQHTTFSLCQSHRWSILNQSFLKRDFRRSGFIFLCFEFVIYEKLPSEYIYGFLE